MAQEDEGPSIAADRRWLQRGGRPARAMAARPVVVALLMIALACGGAAAQEPSPAPGLDPAPAHAPAHALAITDVAKLPGNATSGMLASDGNGTLLIVRPAAGGASLVHAFALPDGPLRRLADLEGNTTGSDLAWLDGRLYTTIPPSTTSPGLLAAYDPRNGTTTVLGSMPGHLGAGTRLMAHAGKVLALGGCDEPCHVVAYDPQTGAFATRTGRIDGGVAASQGHGTAFTALGHEAVLVGTAASGRGLAVVYDAANDTTAHHDLAFAWQGGAAAWIDGRLHLALGRLDGVPNERLRIVDLRNGTIEDGPALGSGSELGDAVTLDCRTAVMLAGSALHRVQAPGRCPGEPAPGPAAPPGPDVDGDGVADAQDACPRIPDGAQGDADGDGRGDACDGALDPDPPTSRPARPGDKDGDGVADAGDVCPDLADPKQGDLDGDLAGDLCDPDADGDGVAQSDGGGRVDLCPFVPDPAQGDKDADGLGDACDEETTVPTATRTATSTPRAPTTTRRDAGAPSALLLLSLALVAVRRRHRLDS